MLILKIKDKGLFVEIPGALPTRTPADIDISRCNLGLVDVYLRKAGITNYQIYSSSQNEIVSPKSRKIPDASLDQKVINKRFSQLEDLVAQVLEKQLVDKKQNSEQITDKLDKLERLAQKLLEKEPRVVEKITQHKTVVEKSRKTKVKDEPDIEELDVGFIPKIDTSNMKMKGGAKKTVKQDKVDLDDSADLLSRIMGQED